MTGGVAVLTMRSSFGAGGTSFVCGGAAAFASACTSVVSALAIQVVLNLIPPPPESASRTARKIKL